MVGRLSGIFIYSNLTEFVIGIQINTKMPPFFLIDPLFYFQSVHHRILVYEHTYAINKVWNIF